MEAREPRVTAAASPQPAEKRPRRVVEITAFVAVWVGLGELLDMNPNIYLVFGIPLTAGFQLYIARRPIHELWVRHADRFALTREDLMLAALLAIVPAISLVIDLRNDGGLPIYLWDLVALCAAVPCAWALRQFVPRTRRYLLFCLATAGPIGLFWLVGVDFLDNAFFHRATDEPSFDLLVFVQYLFLYLPSLFLLEEVVFRGALDSHVQHHGEHHELLTAIYVSVLWGLWHYPVRGAETVIALILVMGTTGIFLSLYWRRSGNLGVSGGTHAFVDSVRNGFGNFPA
jgi:membrane protease YdiL (CAAX protease family)